MVHPGGTGGTPEGIMAHIGVDNHGWNNRVKMADMERALGPFYDPSASKAPVASAEAPQSNRPFGQKLLDAGRRFLKL